MREEEDRTNLERAPVHTCAFGFNTWARLQELCGSLERQWGLTCEHVAELALLAQQAGDELGFAGAVQLLVELPARCLAAPDATAAAACRAAQCARLKAVRQMQIPDIPRPLLEEPSGSHRHAAAASAVPAEAQQPQAQRAPSSRASRRAREFISKGLLSRALAVLTAAPSAPASPEVVRRLHDLHPDNPTPMEDWPARSPSYFARGASTSVRISADVVASAIKLLPRGIASGPSAWTYEMIQSATKTGGPIGAFNSLLLEMVRRASQGRLCCRGILTASRLVALAKPDGGVRPIAVGEAFYRFFGRAMLLADKDNMADGARAYVGANQFGVRAPGGAEVPVHLIRERALCGELAEVVALDWANAYNSLDRVTTARALARRAPSYVPFFEWSYREDSLLILPAAYEARGLSACILSRAGVRQGDPLGPLFFAIGMASVLRALEGLPASQVTAYLDDIQVGLEADHIDNEERANAAHSRVLNVAEEEGAKIGLRLNRAKCARWSPVRAAQAGIKVLGAPVGGEAYMMARLSLAISGKLPIVQAVRSAPDLPLQCKFLLLRQCVAQVPTFWARTVPGAGEALKEWDAAVHSATMGLLGLADAPPGYQPAARAPTGAREAPPEPARGGAVPPTPPIGAGTVPAQPRGAITAPVQLSGGANMVSPPPPYGTSTVPMQPAVPTGTSTGTPTGPTGTPTAVPMQPAMPAGTSTVPTGTPTLPTGTPTTVPVGTPTVPTLLAVATTSTSAAVPTQPDRASTVPIDTVGTTTTIPAQPNGSPTAPVSVDMVPTRCGGTGTAPVGTSTALAQPSARPVDSPAAVAPLPPAATAADTFLSAMRASARAAQENAMVEEARANLLSLPVRLGGFGLRAASATAARAFASSLLVASLRLQQRDLRVCAPSAEVLASMRTELEGVGAPLPQGVARWDEIPDGATLPRWELAAKLQRQLQGLANAHACFETRTLVPERLQGVYYNASCPRSGSWLNCLPVDPQHAIPDREFALLARVKLLHSPATVAALCPTCKSTATDPTHAWTCTSLSRLHSARHDMVVSHLEQAMRACQPVHEHPVPYVLNRIGAQLRANLWLPATTTAIDVVVTAATCGHTMAEALKHVERRKELKYATTLHAGRISAIVPFAVSPFSEIAAKGQAWIAKVLQDAPAKTRRKLVKRVAVAVARGTAMLMSAWQANMAYALP